ncbi:AfsR/SARP family transcriptional regulator [Actinokineospora globicatena]|uniref:AfsR/SARP family transcriptional regulator n=1 Tax=Actinokineospora globicatena TaxID=103729 RepID=UPI0020A2A4DA|nr:BTAD domain-containing putative transcriptional regulator [Actinokineospora globicatena]GLW79006.1 SARP family transcriptional regulator [Actinokineospora globicatena]GLW86583.1 SARP family transcriptional regulator [Actinokineospora globicatena]
MRLGHARQVRVLAALLVDAGKPVPVEHLVCRVWGEQAPHSATTTLYSYVSRLRQSLADTGARIERGSSGYTAEVEPDSVDLHRFRHLIALARSDAKADLLAEALELWHGEPFGTIDSPWFNALRESLLRERHAAAADLVDARLAQGRHAELVPELADRAAAEPLDERVAGQLMLALYLQGQTAAALACFTRTRARLADELGVDPGPELVHLHARVLRGDPDLAPRRPGERTSPPPASARPPAMLPPDVPDFTGRATQVADLRALLAGATPVTVVVGMGGVGKTALALHVAHLMADSFPEGCLSATLRGADEQPVPATDVLARFLRALGMPARAVPVEEVERAEAYRALLRDRKVLVLLDNAVSAEQVRPLLPGSGSPALVTSRDPLSGIAGARRVELGAFDRTDAVRLLAGIVGEARVDEEAEAATRIVRRCGSLPLAVRVAGARLAARPTWRLAHLADLLADERRRLDQLATGDLAVRASLELSYRELDGRRRRLFRLLGLFHAPDFPAWLAATALECSLAEATECAEALVDAQLLGLSRVDPAGQYRYRFHDLVRLFAVERSLAEDSAADRTATLARGLGGWLALAERMAPHVPGPCYAPISGTATRPVDDQLPAQTSGEPTAWFDAERGALVAAVRQACALDLDELAFDLAGALEKYFDLRGMYTDWADLETQVLDLCVRTGNRLGEAVMRRGLADVTTWITDGRDVDAMTRARDEAFGLLELFTALGHEPGMADAAVMCTWALAATGSHAEAEELAHRALELARGTGHRGGQVRALLALAVACFDRRALPEAITHAEAALTAARELGNPRAEATALQFCGIGYRELGELDASARLLSESLAISRRHGDDYTEVLTLLAVARLRLRRSDPGARDAAESAVALSRAHRMTHHVAEALTLLGDIELAGGNPVAAVPYLEESVALWRTRGWRSFQVAALTSLGQAYLAVDPRAAQAAFREARSLDG